MRQDDKVPEDNKDLEPETPSAKLTPKLTPGSHEDSHETAGDAADEHESHAVNPEDYADEVNEREAIHENAVADADDADDSDDSDADASSDADEQSDLSTADQVEAAADSHEIESENSNDDSASNDGEFTPGSDGESDADSPARAASDSDQPDAPARPRSKSRAKSAAAIIRRAVTLVVNDEPGDECRIAVLADQRLDSYFSEREASATNVGSIYKGRVMNVEGAIQAAFIDFGSGQNGFLHISDLHPKYFPGEERTEQVGKKIGRSERPLIQQALRKGQEIMVQVIKEGLGSKGPTLTSYLSLPGRLLVMMPDMDRVGVSRRVDDEDQRREMRKILDSLKLPDGFGFILRTAGFDSTKTELLRDAAYLQRLWDAMEKRSNRTGAPCELYTESDVLVRTLRDHTDSSVESIIVDSPGAFERAKMFLDVIAPNSSGKVMYYNGKAPIFEAYGIERQIDEIHLRTVPLPSGGALVFDQTEALVAIDVNSGKSRSARDSETNAYQTNCEAVEEICRQLRLRDLGGLIAVDCIDMRMPKHRRDIEDRLTALLKLDRAKSSFAPISDFGIIEMTRQRMRPSLRKMHYADCQHCAGSGEIRVPGAVAADAMRRVALLFSVAKIQRVEIVCSVRVAAELISNRRPAMHELEERFSKRIDVRISEAFAADRVEMYGYDENNSDMELDRLPRPSAPDSTSLHAELPEADELELTPSETLARRRRRKRRPAPADATAIALAGGFDDLPAILDNESSVRDSLADSDDTSDESSQRSARSSGDSRRRGGRSGRGRRNDQASSDAGGRASSEPGRAGASKSDSSPAGPDSQSPRRRRRGRGRRSIDSIGDMVAENAAFELARVAFVLGTSVEELVEKLRGNVDPEIAALITPQTLMLPPELIARTVDLYPQASADAGADSRPQTDMDSQQSEPPSGAASRAASKSTDSEQHGGEQRQRRSRRGGGRGGRRGSGGGSTSESSGGGGNQSGGGSGGGNQSGSGGGSGGSNQGGRGNGDRGNRGNRGDRNQRPAQSSAPNPFNVARSDSPKPQPQSEPVNSPAPTPPPSAPSAVTPDAATAKPKRRSLYGAAVRLLSSLERSKAKGRPE